MMIAMKLPNKITAFFNMTDESGGNFLCLAVYDRLFCRHVYGNDGR